jgi:hypothetical protein
MVRIIIGLSKLYMGDAIRSMRGLDMCTDVSWNNPKVDPLGGALSLYHDG